MYSYFEVSAAVHKTGMHLIEGGFYVRPDPLIRQWHDLDTKRYGLGVCGRKEEGGGGGRDADKHIRVKRVSKP